ncbi:hypothetical protein JCM8097_002275 [Rhodosporidiobolus ruineniae]
MPGSVQLPMSPEHGPLLAEVVRKHHHRHRGRPAAALSWLAVACACFFAGFFSRSLPHPSTFVPASVALKTAAYLPTRFSASLSPPSHAPYSLSASRSTPPSCRVCDRDPTNQLCEYGDSAIRLSRAYEGSDLRVRRFLEKALRGEEVTVGIIGASVTAGHGIGDHPTWVERWFDGFQARFPNARLVNGAAPAMTSRFYSYCVDTLVPEPADLYLIELDINDELTAETMVAVDGLFRTLLTKPQQPAVIRMSIFALAFEDLIRGTAATLVQSQFFDVPVISVRNFLQPLTIAQPDVAPSFFTLFPDGKTDFRHLSAPAHDALADMLTLYLSEQTCLTEQEAHARPRLLAKEGTVWPSEEVLGMVPRLKVFQDYSPTRQPPSLTPLCNFASSPHRPLIPLPPSQPGEKGWERMEWNDKSAIVSAEVGAVVRFEVEGTSAGVFVWQHPGPSHPTHPSKRPGQAVCWIDDDLSPLHAKVVDAFALSHAPSPEWIMVREEMEPGKHVLSCQITDSTQTGGHEVRIMGVVSH